ncbi:MAG TPA: MATE family efflux transporter, partial [Lachnospiraceae bacterium]|nr:MATE family efflux transporter [Lachnospiraceae bacterium]
QICTAILYLIVYRKKNFAITIHPKYLKMDLTIVKSIYSVGIPSSLMMILPSILVSVLNSILKQFSDLYINVLGIYFKLQTFIYMPANGIVQGMRPIIGYNYGAKDYHRMKSTIRYSLLSAGIIMLLGTLLSMIIPREIFMLFQSDPSLLSAGSTALRIISLGFLISTIGIIFSGTFEAIGKGKESLIISLLRQFILTIPLSLILSRIPSIGVNGVWISFPIGELCASIVAYFLLKKQENGVL